MIKRLSLLLFLLTPSVIWAQTPPLRPSLRGAWKGTKLLLSPNCRTDKPALLPGFHLLPNTAPFAKTPADTPLCQRPGLLLWEAYKERGTKAPLKRPPQVTKKSLPKPSLRPQRKAAPVTPKIDTGRFTDDLGIRERLTRPLGPEKTFGFTMLQFKRLQTKPPSLVSPSTRDKRRFFLGTKPLERRDKGWLTSDQKPPLPPLKMQLPRFDRLAPPDKPLYDQKVWPVPWPEARKVPPAKWSSKWDDPNDQPFNKKKPIPDRSLGPKQVIALLKEANKLRREEKFYDALKRYERILEVIPDHLPALRAKARMLVWLNKLKEARAAYDDLFATSPGDLSGYLGMADLASRERRFKEAIKWYKLYLQYVPNDVDALKGLGRAAARSKQKELAKTSFKKVLTLKKGDLEAGAFLSDRNHTKPFFFSFGMEHRFFTNGRVGMMYEPKFGMKYRNQLFFLAGLRLDFRFLPQATLYELLPHGEIIWTPYMLPGFKFSAFIGGSPLATYYPQMLLDVGAKIPVPFLTTPAISGLINYRFYLFPTRQSHLLIPGVELRLFNFIFLFKYFLNLNYLLDIDQFLVLHALFFQVEWQVLWFLVLKAGVGWGNFADYLLNSFQTPTFGPAAGSAVFAENAFFFNLGAQIELPKSQFLILGYRYYQEAVTLFPQQPPDYEVHFHTIMLSYRVYFDINIGPDNKKKSKEK